MKDILDVYFDGGGAEYHRRQAAMELENELSKINQRKNLIMTHKEYQEKQAELRRQLKENAERRFSEASKVLFDENPGLNEFSFTAYTPFFADGDTPQYSAKTEYPDINGECGYDIESYYDEIPLPLSVALQEKVANFLGQFHDDEIMEMFGDHIKVTVRRDNDGSIKTEVKEYDRHH